MSRDFADLFKGREDAYGQYGDISGVVPTDRGKRAAPSSDNTTVHASITSQVYESHLAGIKRLGIPMLLKDSTVNFCVMDVDWYLEKGLHEDIVIRIKQENLPLFVTRSKSNGAHVYAFFERPCPANLAIEQMEEWKRVLRLPKTHVDYFPTGDDAKKVSVGNWINIPYFGDSCKWFDGVKDRPLHEFLQSVNEHLVPIPKKKKKKKSKLPPCVDYMLEEGVPEGYRNDGTVQYAIAMYRAYPDDWEERVEEFAAEKCDPPLEREDIKNILRSVSKKGDEYQYLCTKIKPMFCNITECKKRQFGVGTSMTDIPIEHVEVICGENPVYRITMEGKRFACSAADFINFNKFRVLAFAVINRIIPHVNANDWMEYVNNAMVAAEYTQAGSDTQMRDRIVDRFRMWISQSCTPEDTIEEALEAGRPFYDKKNFAFRGGNFMQTIERDFKISRDECWLYLRDHGVIQQTIPVKGIDETLWVYIVKEALWFDINKGGQI
tara:strand:- start:2940 stop:4418 length:1479 start_codon:yes stop_codon:yes gene_type:complete